MAEDVFGIVGSVIASAYHVEGVVAEGGFGVVYRAHHGGFRAPVALKLLKVPQQGAREQAEFLELFRAEAELLFRLSASLPTVVRPLHVDAFTASDGRFVPYLVLEWLDGMTLEALIEQRGAAGLPPVGLRKLVRLLTPVARALERAHNFSGPEGAVSIVHRDLKPQNIFVAQVAGEEVVKILDFGIGKVKSVASQVAGRMSQTGTAPTAFTPAYAAPEQWAPRHYGQTGPWTDVWGLALCMVEVIAGRPLIEGDPATMMGITLDTRRRPTPRNEGVEVPPAVEAVFARALALDPRARQRDAGVFWNELVAALQLPEAERGGGLARDARAEEGPSSGRIERVERVELRPRISGSMPRVTQPSAAAERALASDTDLEFDPMSASQAASQRVPIRPADVPIARTPAPNAERAASVSGAHVVPDLELAPPLAARRPSGAHVITPTAERAPNVLDFEDPAEGGSGLDLHLDLPADEPMPRRTVSSQYLPAVPVSPRHAPSRPPPALSGSMPAQRVASPSRPLSVPPPAPLVSGARSSSPELGLAGSEPARAARASVPPRASTPPLSADTSAQFESGFVAPTGAELTLPAERTLVQRLRPAFALLGAAIFSAVLDPIYAALTGEVLEIIGLRLSLFAGAFLVLALGLAVRELVREHS